MYFKNEEIKTTIEIVNILFKQSNLKYKDGFNIDYLESILDEIYTGEKYHIKHSKKASYLMDKTQLFIIFFSHLSLACIELNLFENDDIPDSKRLNFLLTAMFSNYSNTLIKLLDSVKDGYDYQASLLIRPLIELSFLIVSLLIDNDKLYLYFSLEENYDKELWENNFSFSSLNSLLSEYEKEFTNNSDKEFIKDLRTWRKNIYKFYSGHTHNAGLPTTVFAYSHPENDEDFMHLNMFGKYVTRIEYLLRDIEMVLYYTMFLVFSNLEKKYYPKPDHSNQTWSILASIYFTLEVLIYKNAYNEEPESKNN